MSAVCAKNGCNLPAYVEPRTSIVHKYCGRTHALEVEGSRVQPPHGNCHLCNLSGCQKSVAFDPSSGRVHDFCCRDHADKAIKSGRWKKPIRDAFVPAKGVKTGRLCCFPSCRLPVYQDFSGRAYDYCGRSHAIEHRLLQTRVGHIPSSSASSGSTKSSSVAASKSAVLKLSPTKTYILQFDGGSRGNPGPCGAGMVLYEENNPSTALWCGSHFLTEHGTNNEAEYQALILGLKCAHLFGADRIVAQGDSELVVQQILGNYKCERSNLLPLFKKATMLKRNFVSFEIRHIPRAQNYRADELANEAIISKCSRGMEALLGD